LGNLGNHGGWMSACQIVTIPSLNELGIFIQDGCQSNIGSLIENFTEYPNIWVYVRYLQTGQIERKHIKDIRMLGGLRIGVSISIRSTLRDGSNAWSGNLSLMEHKAYAGGLYAVTAINAGEEDNNIVFMTIPPVGFDDFVIQTDQHEDLKDLQEFEYSLLGPSTVFTQKPKLGEKIQIYVDGLWHDVKVTKVCDKDVEYVNWSSEDVIPAEDTENEDSEDILGFTEDALIGLEKGNKRTWCPWEEEINTWDIRPYRCLHIGDLVEAPVVYPDYNYCYHSLEESQLYLLARIIEVEEDRYLVEFNPAVIAYKWWPGRSSNPDKFPRKRGDKETVENRFRGTKVWVSMDRVRPYLGADPHPVLGISSMRPHSWSAFQGVQFADLQQFSEDFLWKQ
ncbi:17164_t:CDS:2, partial [Dentiscutata heterogama]